MSESISKFFSLLIALIFFTISVSIITDIDHRIKGLISNRQNKNYAPSELSLVYSGGEKNDKGKTYKDKMMAASLLLEQSRSEEEDVIVEVFGERVNLSVKNEDEKKILDEEGNKLDAKKLMSFMVDNRDFSLNFFYKDLDIENIILVEKED